MFDLTGKVAFVTGASSGIGMATAIHLAKQGAKVAVAARRLDKLEKLAEDIAVNKGEAFPLQLDITNVNEIKNAINKVEDKFGGLDILVNNAGVNVFSSGFSMKEEEWDLVIDTNLKGAFFAAQYAARKMVKRRWGRIINISSVLSGGVGSALPGEVNYCASKGGMVAMTSALALEFASSGITVNAVGPGFVETEMTENWIAVEDYRNMLLSHIPLKRMGTVDEIAAGIVFLASNEASYITGATLYIDGGWTSA